MTHNYTVFSIYHIAKADFLQRIRSYNFLIALGACVFLIYSFVPDLDAGYVMVSLGNYRGFYNSAWIGGMVANCVPFFALIGFYLVNYAVKRDADTGVGQIIATTRITKVQYLTGKLFSNFAVLLLILLVIAVMTIIMFLARGETGQLELGKLLFPLIFLTVPAMFIIASIALFFDALTILNRGMINIIYFFLWTFLISISLLSPLLDVFGISIFMTEIKNTIPIVHQDWNGEFGTGLLLRDSVVNNEVFIWEGMIWSKFILLPRLFWLAASFGLVFLASLGFNRFDASKKNERQRSIPLYSKKKSTLVHENATRSHRKLRNAPFPEASFNFFSILIAEMRLMVRGKSTSWVIITCVLFIISILSPLNFAYKVTLPLLWLFQILILSRLGSREITSRSNEYIFSTPYPLKRQLPATLTAASLYMLSLALPVILRVLLKGDFYGVYAIFTGALFIPTFAIALGIITGGSKLFEVMFTIIVYGYFNNVPFFDFTGAIEESHKLGIANYLLLFTLVLVIVAFSGRKRQIMHI
jgi:hypothetical protein